MVQSVLGAKSLKEGQLGTNFTAWLKILDVPLFILPGILCFVLFPTLENPDEAYMTMVSELLPSGMVGLIVTVLMAALISTIASALNSLGAIVTLDIYVRRFKPAASQRQVVSFGRWVALVGSVVSVFLASLISKAQGMDLFSLFQSILSFLAPPISAVFIVGVCWKRASSLAANVTLIFGTLVSLGIGFCFLSGFPSTQAWPHFLLLSFLIFAGLCLLMVGVTLVDKTTEREPSEMSLRSEDSKSADLEKSVKTAWLLLGITMVCLYIVFN
jgi:SSS family solute:Na+ symporter